MAAKIMIFNFVVIAASVRATASRPVDRYFATWSTPAVNGSVPMPAGQPRPPDGPYAGNGDLNVMYSGNSTADAPPRSSTQSWQQWFYLSKNDLWGSDAKMYYTHLSAGRVGMLVVPAGAQAETTGVVTMFPGNASITHSLTASDGASVSGMTRVLEENVVVTTFVCAAPSGGTCNATLLLSDTNRNVYGVTQDVGSAPDGSLIWWRKEIIHNALNPAYLGSCDPHTPLQSTERTFTVDGSGYISMANGSCLWVDEAAAPGIITPGACVPPQGVWMWKGAASKGDILQVSSGQCLSESLTLGACGAMPWAQIPAGDGNVSHVYLSIANSSEAAPSGCIVAVPDNNNNTLGVALGVADASGNLVKGTVAPVSADPADGTTLSLSLQAGTEYTILIGVQTLRDLGCAGIRPQWQTCTTSPQEVAAALVQAMASPAGLAAAVQASEAFWSDYWAASSVDITASAPETMSTQLHIVERWYYMSQYLLACTTRDGKVTSALDGFACIEPVPWADQFTLDYNLEATFWGAGSSNRLAFIHPVMASTTNPGAVATARLRAQNPGTWGVSPHWPGVVGKTTPGAVCMPDCPNLTTTGFQGAEWPSAGMPMGNGGLADSDLQTRFVGGLLSTNLIQYFEYSRNMTTLAQIIYPFVRDNAEFYLSYAITGSDGKLVFPFSCAQEACECRNAEFIKEPPNVPLPNFTTTCQNPNSAFKSRCPDASGWELNHPCYECYPDIATGSDDGYHNAHPDVAFASYSFRNAVRFATLLGVDSDRIGAWQAALAAMPAYPAANFTWLPGAAGSEFNGGPGFLVEAEYGHHPGVLPNGSSTVPVTWPWCNREYPISNFAAMWPTDEIGVPQTQDRQLLALAKNTVYALNKYQAKPWANVNGFCLSWPPAVRLSDQSDAAFLINAFSTAILSTTVNNACVLNHGGMLENIGATVAINDLLLQSHGGLMRFFPVWNATALGPASFTTLRAYGAFLVSASVDAEGIVSPIALASEVGGDVVFASPWPGAVPSVVDSHGNSIHVTPGSTTGVYSFPTTAGTTYTLSSSEGGTMV